ncbi:MAG: ATP-dependent Clp protease adapter ClpS [Deltaproteobacteria bacterium]|nr:ATP-dependent Clp protease adapter ClpS [Deltaproteobacteria bacterium]
MSEPKAPAKRDPGQLLVQEKARVKRPPMYAVVLLNDDYTPMEFVVWVLQGVFYKTPDEASRLMLQVHNEGRGVAGVFTHDVARTKALQVEQLARKHEHPLECQIEACEG